MIAVLLVALLHVPRPAGATERACSPRVIRLPDLGYGSGAIGVRGSIVVGFVLDGSGGQHPAIWRDGRLSILSWHSGFGGDVNGRGEVVGTAEHMHIGFAVTDATVHLLPPSPGSFVYARRVNDRGQIAGAAFDGNYAARWDSVTAAPVRLDPAAGDTYSFAKGINDAGVVAGDSDDAQFVPYPAIWSPTGQVTVFPSGLGAGEPGDLFAINNRGVSVGESFDGGFTLDQATAWSPAGDPTLVPLLPGTNQSTALNVNNVGWVVGEAASGFNYATGSGISHVFVWFGHGATRTLPVPGLRFADSESDGHGVDDAGTVVGSSGPAGGPDTATVWTCAARQAFVPGDAGVATTARAAQPRGAGRRTLRALFAERRSLGWGR